MIGADLLALAIKRQGVETVFSLPGHLESFYGALEVHEFRLIHMRHEAAVIMAADGYARTRKGIGVACVTAGPGLANALGGLASAYDACTPLLVITGCNPMAMADSAALQDMDHTRVARPMTKWAATVREGWRLAEYVDRACRIALSGRPGPVLLEIPRDLSEGEVDAALAEPALKPLIKVDRPLADAESIERAADLLAEAERPLVIAGNGAYWGDAGPGLRRLAEEFRLPVFTKGAARGLVTEDMETGFGFPLAWLAAREADVVLVAGARMGHPMGYAAPPFYSKNARFIQIDIDGSEIGRNRYVEAPVVGDCGPAVDALAQALERRHNQPKDTTWVNKALAPRIARLNELGRESEGQVHPLHMARELKKRLPDNAIFVGDGANCLNWYKAEIEIKDTLGWMDQDPFGSMGVGVPMALGAVAAEQETGSNRPVFVGTGDGAFGQYLGELATLSLHGLPLFIMVANDGSWGASRNITLNLFGGTFGALIDQSRYDVVAEGLGCHGELASTPDEVGPAMDRALAAVADGKPTVLNVIADAASGELRSDPLLQMVTFNPAWFDIRSGKG